jgi:FAD-dependent urate hydroxylase
MTTPHVLIIGGGIAGPVTAIALRRHGITATLFEAYERGAEGVGAFLTLAPNGQDALDALGLGDLVRDDAFRTPALRFYSGSGKRLGEIRTGSPDGTLASVTVKRGDLYGRLRDEAVRQGAPIEYGKRLVDATVRGDRAVAHFADGSTAEGDLIIGADGLGSRLRRIIDPACPPPRYTGLLNTGGFATGLRLDAEPGVAHMYFGSRCFFSYQIAPDGSVWWFANPPAADDAAVARFTALTSAQLKEELIGLMSGDALPAREIIEHTGHDIAVWRTEDLPTVPRWSTDRMLLVGDAAHAASPSSGQGASMAIEDAVILAACLAQAPDPTAAFTRFEQLRRARVEKIIAHGKRGGDTKTPGPLGVRIRDLMMPMFLKYLAKRDVEGWIYRYRVTDALTPTATSTSR